MVLRKLRELCQIKRIYRYVDVSVGFTAHIDMVFHKDLVLFYQTYDFELKQLAFEFHVIFIYTKDTRNKRLKREKQNDMSDLYSCHSKLSLPVILHNISQYDTGIKTGRNL